jgi:hypothetical protein
MGTHVMLGLVASERTQEILELVVESQVKRCLLFMETIGHGVRVVSKRQFITAQF